MVHHFHDVVLKQIVASNEMFLSYRNLCLKQM